MLKKSVFADEYSIYKQIKDAKKADITKAISYLQQKKIIRVSSHRNSSRTGLSIPVYSLVLKHSSSTATDNGTSKLDIRSLLTGITSERAVEYGFLGRSLSLSRNNMKILDVGSEECAVTNALGNFGKDKHWEVFGIDISDRLPKLLEDECTRNGSNFHLIRMDAKFMGYRDEVFDEIICISTIEHIGIQSSPVKEYDEIGDIKAFSEIFRVLKKGGQVILTLPYADKGSHGYHKEHRIYSSYALGKLISGFRIKRRESYIYNKGKWIKESLDANKLKLLDNTELPIYVHSRICLCLLLEKK